MILWASCGLWMSGWGRGGCLKLTVLNKCVTSVYSWKLIAVFTDTEMVGFGDLNVNCA